MAGHLPIDVDLPRVLVVDDDEEVAKSIEATLKRNYQVCVVHSGVSAIKEARRHLPDIIVLDVIMQGMDGLETCRQLRLDPLLSDIPILFLTALGRPEDRVAGLRAGGDDYLTKPFNLEELQLRIKAILRRVKRGPSAPPQSLISVSNLILDRNSFLVSTGKRESKLTPVEFDLLYHLMTHPNEVFTSDRLLQEVWDYPSETGSPDLVRMHIKNLRRKIEVDPSNPKIILTIPRRGYTIATK
ncbi:MAG TPA: response regulator transcription factor [Anaerolineae bacterium]|nr:response regulator transcription factor [Anaerolineae bacterium]HMR63608.1 response regulator transcription factor [Anaerolineae bacterium]